METVQQLTDHVQDARRRTIDSIEGFSPDALLGPQLAIVNPPLWEIGHVAWFQERWVLRHALGEPPLHAHGDPLYDSTNVPHAIRWSLPLPSLEETLQYLEEVRDRVLDRLQRAHDDRLLYFVLLSVFHEDMHLEAFAYTRQTLGYPRPPGTCGSTSRSTIDPDPPSGLISSDREIGGGPFMLGTRPKAGFVFDNEKWAHPVEVRPFTMARTAVTQSEFAAFVDDGGYRQPALWSPDGWTWRTECEALHPVYWKRDGTQWIRREFDQWVELEADLPALHVNFFEAEAYCRWAGRRLPTEAEWEFAAAGSEEPDKRTFPWGHEPPTESHAHLGLLAPRPVSVNDKPAGDSASGCRQLIGNVWEWTASVFRPYPGFVEDPYRAYSAPWFHTHRVLRGGSLATPARLVRNTWRNFALPHRRDIWAGFRTCAAL